VSPASIGGTPLDPDRTYLVATVDFLANGNEGFGALKSAVRVDTTGRTVAEVVEAFIRKRGIVAPVAEGRIRAIAAHAGSKKDRR
jgi:2',3'-cyclic-nucleotide 2'-phosphodiesterase (5'-nucleotidase family)